MFTEKFKIQAILRSSPDRQLIDSHTRSKKHGKDSHKNQIIFTRKSNLPVPKCKDKQTKRYESVDLRQKIIATKECLSRPPSNKQKQSQLFTEKCFSLLSRKKKSLSSYEGKSKVHDMMANIVEKYKANAQINKKYESIESYTDVSATYHKCQSSQFRQVSDQDNVEVYRMLKTSDSSKRKKIDKKQQQWKQIPDVTGVRMNKFFKGQSHDIHGVECFSLPLSQMPMPPLKRFNMISSSGQQTNQKRALSQASSRKQIKINKIPNNKYMAFSKNDADMLYMKKLKSFLDFIFKINFSNKIYVSLSLSDDTSSVQKYKAYVGKGNNSLLIKSLLKRRFWFELVDDAEEQGISFFWSQNKIDRIHYKQTTSSQFKSLYDRESSPEKKREMKSPEQKQIIELNKKILHHEEIEKVQKFIQKNGYTMPFDAAYSCPIVTNHIPRNNCIGSKKNLFKSLYHYYRYCQTDPFEYIPKTYSIKNAEDPEFKKFLKEYEKYPEKVWIVKPGENTNRGNGIKLSETGGVIDLIRRKQKHANGQLKTYILQSYIERPFLYNNRKFDIRHFMLLTSVNGILKAYWYKEGYLRTSSYKYDLQDLDDPAVHLTNDAIQQKYQSYEKHEPGNKLSYNQFQRYLDLTYPAKGLNFERDAIPEMKSIIVDVIKANYNILDKNRRECNFQIFGFDFMLDRNFKPWLIQINYNPCLEVSCPLLSRIIPIMVQSSLRIGLDPLLPPMNHYSSNRRYTLSDNYLKNQRYELIFDESNFQETVPVLYDIDDSDEEEQEYCDDGKQIQDLQI